MEIINLKSIKRNWNLQTKTEEYFKNRCEINSYANWKNRRLEDAAKKRVLLAKSPNIVISEINNNTPENIKILHEIKAQMISFSYMRESLNLNDETIYKLNELILQCDKYIYENYFPMGDYCISIDEIIDAACILKSEIVIKNYQI